MFDRRRLMLAGAGAPWAAPLSLRAQTPPRVRLVLDWTFQAPNAFALVARERGFFRDAGVEVQVDRGQGSGAVPPALAAGTHDMGYADLNPAIRFLAQNPESGLVAVAILHDRSPLCVITRADGPVRTPKDLEGRRLAAPDFDAGRQLFPAFAKAAGVDASRVQFLSVAPQLREPMLARREADGVTGFVTTSALALKGIGLDLPQQRVMMYYDHGLDLYGGALLTTRRFLEANPEAVRRATAALLRGFRDQLGNATGAMAVLRQAEPLIDVALETERHRLNVERVIMTENVRANGLSNVDMRRLQTGIAAVEEAFGLPARLRAEQLYVPDFLPAAADRRV